MLREQKLSVAARGGGALYRYCATMVAGMTALENLV